MYDGKLEAVATALKVLYPDIMGRCWTIISSDEVLQLKETTKRIRERKVYD